jgi:hypothetical protein
MQPAEPNETNNNQKIHPDQQNPVSKQNNSSTPDKHKVNQAFNTNPNNKSFNTHIKFLGLSTVKFVALLAILIAAAGIFWYRHQSSIKNSSSAQASSSKQTSDSNSLQFFGNPMPKVKCSSVAVVAHDKDIFKSSSSKYLCNAGNVVVDKENIKVIAISLTPKFENEYKSKCQIDCGFSGGDIPPEEENVGEFIVRANGNVEKYGGFGGGGLDSLLSELTGCGSFNLTNKLQNGTLVIYDNKVGLKNSFTNLQIGNSCTADLRLITYISSPPGDWSITLSEKVTNLAVHYNLSDVSSCKNGTAQSRNISCYVEQAVSRNDLSICENLASPTPKPDINPGYDDCITAVAKRRVDPSVCENIRYYRDELLATCKKDTSNLKNVFSGQLIVK